MSDDQQSQQVGKAGSTVVLATGARIVSQLITLSVLVLAGRFLSPELFGVFVLATIFLNIASSLQYSGIYNYILREGGLRTHIRSAFTLHALFGLLFSIGIVVLAGLIHVFGGSRLLVLLILTTAPIPLGLIFTSWFEALVLRSGEVKFYYWVLLGAEIIGFIATVCLFLLGFEIWSLILSKYLSVSLLALVLLFKVRGIPIPGIQMDHLKKVAAYSVPLYGDTALGMFTAYGAEVAIGTMLNSRAVGLFRMGVRTSNAAFDVFSQTARVLIWQIVGQLAREDRIHEPIWIKIYAFLLAVVATALGILCVVAEPFVVIVLGEKWLPIVPVIQIVCCVRILSVFSLIANAQLAASGATRFVLKVRGIEAFALAASLALFLSYGMLGAAFALFPPTIIGCVFLYRRLKLVTNSHFLDVFVEVWRSMIISSLSVASALLVYMLGAEQSPWVQVLASSLVSGSVFLGLSFFVFRAWTMGLVQTLSAALHVRDSDPNDISLTK